MHLLAGHRGWLQHIPTVVLASGQSPFAPHAVASLGRGGGTFGPGVAILQHDPVILHRSTDGPLARGTGVDRGRNPRNPGSPGTPCPTGKMMSIRPRRPCVGILGITCPSIYCEKSIVHRWRWHWRCDAPCWTETCAKLPGVCPRLFLLLGADPRGCCGRRLPPCCRRPLSAGPSGALPFRSANGSRHEPAVDAAG